MFRKTFVIESGSDSRMVMLLNVRDLEHGPFPWVFFHFSQDIHSAEHIQMFDI